MTQPLDFSNQDLRDRSFKGREDLAGGNFQKADVRGCDFSGTDLDGADFSGVTAGQSGKQIFVAFAFAGAGAFAGAVTVAVASTFGLMVALVGAGAGAFAFMFAGASAFAGAFAGAFEFAGAYAAIWIVSAVAGFAGFAAYVFGFTAVSIAFPQGNIISVIGYSLFVLILLFVSYIMLKQLIEGIRNLTGTSFKSATLTKSKFMGAILKNCDFTDAKLEQTDWTHARFSLCNFSGNLSYQKTRELCITRIGTNEDFSYGYFSSLNLIGVTLRMANLSNTNLNNTNLTQADLENANLANVQAIQTDFTKADLSGACIANWAITSETIFTDTVCTHIYLESDQKERKPASGSFQKGDFEKLVVQFTKTLDFLFRYGIDPQAFDFALNNLIEDYEEMAISLKSVDDLGDGDRLVRFNTIPDAPKVEMHAQFTQDYVAMHQQLESSRSKVRELQQNLNRIDLENKLERSELEKQLALAIAKLEERPTSKDLQNLLYHQSSQLGKQKLIYASNSTINMTDKSIQSGGDTFIIGDKNKGVFGKDQQGAAGRDISGTVTNTIQQLRETNQPEAPKLSDLLEQLQKAVETSSELGEPEKQKALKYLNQIGEMSAKDPSQKKGMLPILLDAFTGVISKAANLIDPVKKIAAAILSIWQA